MPHVAHAITAGWPALARGGRLAVLDLELAAPTSAALIFLGSSVQRPILSPLTRRATRLPPAARLLLAGGFVAAGFLAWRAVGRRPSAAGIRDGVRMSNGQPMASHG